MRGILLVAVALSSCAGDRAAPPPATQASPPVILARPPLPPLDVERAPSEPALFSRRDDAVEVALRSAVIQTGARSVGSTSLVLKVPLDGGAKAAFKPATKKHGERWRGEVAAYRVARLLGLDNVPVAVPRAARLDALFASTRSASTLRLMRGELVADDGRVSGAMIAWIPGLKRLPLEDDPLFTAWGQWLSVAPPAVGIERRVAKSVASHLLEAKPLAAQISTLVAFDHVIGNRDRWSGHNVLVDMTGTRLVFLDHNLAFDAALDRAATKKRTFVLHRVQRFSRALVTRLRAFDRPALLEALGADDRDQPLLAPAQVDALLARRDELLAWIDELVGRYGEERVLSFE